MILTLVCSPFTLGNADANIEYARKAMRHSFFMDEVPIATHLLWPQVMSNIGGERVQTSQGTDVLLSKCERVVLYVDRGLSQGMEREWHLAKKLRKQILFRSISKWDIHAPKENYHQSPVFDTIKAFVGIDNDSL
jgi:hypothetical protein